MKVNGAPESMKKSAVGLSILAIHLFCLAPAYSETKVAAPISDDSPEVSTKELPPDAAVQEKSLDEFLTPEEIDILASDPSLAAAPSDKSTCTDCDPYSVPPGSEEPPSSQECVMPEGSGAVPDGTGKEPEY